MAQLSCLCGSISQSVKPRNLTGSDQITLSLCHCNTCRYTTGLLCASYFPILEPELSDKLRIFRTSKKSARYFCSTCGCHVFCSLENDAGEVEWGAATGVISATDEGVSGDVRYATHQHVSDTKDGGIAEWILLEGKDQALIENTRTKDGSNQPAALEAACACGTVRFHLTRPNSASLVPRRNYSDLIYPYCDTGDSILANPSDEKWWVRGNKYLAGTCACRSCRLISGFEIQTWAFVPRANIFFHTLGGETESSVPVDFDTLPSGILQSYKSSQAATREFCGTCGATVFWHEAEHAEIIDVSVGLLRASDGARAESWLEWCKGRVSFAEEVQTGRSGPLATAAHNLIDTLSVGMKR